MRNLIRKSTKKNQLIILALKCSLIETKIQLSKVEFKTWKRGLDYRTVGSRKYPESRAEEESREQEERRGRWGSSDASAVSAGEASANGAQEPLKRHC